MSVTGHRSLNSLSVYQKVSDTEKIQMGYAMNAFLQTGNQVAIQKATTQLRPIAPKPAQTAAITVQPNPPESTKNDGNNKQVVIYEPEDPILQEEFNEELNFDVEAVLQQIEEESVSLTQTDTSLSTSTTIQHQKIRKSPNIPIFNNCKICSIGNLHIHVHKN